MTRKPYPTDLADDQWQALEPLLPRPRSGTRKGGRPAADTREVVNALCYLLRSGAAGRLLPNEFPPWKTVYTRFRLWRLGGVWGAVHARLREDVRLAAWGRSDAGHPAGRPPDGDDGTRRPEGVRRGENGQWPQAVRGR